MGRRISMYLGTITALIGILFLLIENMWAMMFGKLFIGISMGIIFTIHGRILEEFSPPHMYGPLLTFFILLCTIVDSLCIVIAGEWLPEDRE
jgi:MFS family permease